MKRIANFLFFSSLMAAALVSCKKDENRIYFEGGTAPVLTANTTALNLSFANTNQEALKLMWTNPDYQFTTGLSSQDVNYIIEIDTTGANFTNPNKQSVGISRELSKSFTQGEFNDFLLNQLGLKFNVPHDIEIRVKSALGSNAVSLISNVLKYRVTPFEIPPKVTPPASAELYITGSAVASDWTNSPPASQKFTRVSNTLYELTIALSGGKSYTFLPVHGSWDHKFSIAKKNDENMVNGGDFQAGGEDILAPAVSGTYKIEVDFQRGKFKVTKL